MYYTQVFIYACLFRNYLSEPEMSMSMQQCTRVSPWRTELASIVAHPWTSLVRTESNEKKRMIIGSRIQSFSLGSSMSSRWALLVFIVQFYLWKKNLISLNEVKLFKLHELNRLSFMRADIAILRLWIYGQGLMFLGKHLINYPCCEMR